MAHACVSVEHVTKYFYYPRKRMIVHDFSATCHAACMHVIAGASGVGKSTLLACIAGIESIDAGRVVYDDTCIHAMSPEQRTDLWSYHVGIVLQNPLLIQEVSVWDNIAMKGYINGASQQYIQEQVTYLLELVGMSGYADAYPSEISGGQQQRVALARALLYTPSVIIADEPTAHLDAHNTNLLVRVCTHYRDAHGCSIILATHDDRVIEYADVVHTL